MASPHSPAPPTPRSAQPSPSPPPPTATNFPSPIPLNSHLRTHPLRNLPTSLSSTYPHGHLSGHLRTPSQQRSFDARKAEILSTMTAEQIDRRYVEATEKVKAVLENREREEREVQERMEKLRMQREVERRVWERLRGRKEGG